MKFEVGEKYTRLDKNTAGWPGWVQILDIGSDPNMFWLIDNTGRKMHLQMSDSWLPYEEPKPPQKPSERINEILKEMGFGPGFNETLNSFSMQAVAKYLDEQHEKEKK